MGKIKKSEQRFKEGLAIILILSCVINVYLSSLYLPSTKNSLILWIILLLFGIIFLIIFITERK